MRVFGDISLFRLINLGTDEGSMPLGMVKNIRMFNRINLLSILSLALYTLVMLVLGSALNALFCLLSLFAFILVAFQVYRGRRGSAKLLYSSWIFLLILVFSFLFGQNIGSQFWLVIVGGLSLLIFRQRSNAFRMVLIGLLVFFIIDVFIYKMDPFYDLGAFFEGYVFSVNIIFIFCTNFLISYVLRFSSEDYQRMIAESNKSLQFKNRNLTDSISYAKRIQDAILPHDRIRDSYRHNFFVLFEPKDIVSGDFYWVYPMEDRIFFAVVDGAGYGVSGALTSIISHTLLTQCVEEYRNNEVLAIYQEFKSLIYKRKEMWNDQLIEDIEVSICSYNWNTGRLGYASNGNYFYLVKHVNNVEAEDGIDLTNQDRYAMKEIRKDHNFDTVPRLQREAMYAEFNFRKDDMVYLATNGFSRQLGGPRYKKLKSQRLKDLLMSVQHFNVYKQKHIIADILFSWRGKLPGTDDITLLGFKI